MAMDYPSNDSGNATADEQRGVDWEKAGAMKACTRRCGIHGPFLFEH